MIIINLLNRIYVYFSAGLLYLSIMLVCKTLRFKIVGGEEFYKLKEKTNLLIAVWHQATFVLFYIYRRQNAYLLVSAKTRGRILGKCSEWLGYKSLPVSEEKDTISAGSTIKALKLLKKDSDMIIALDGPLGPAFVVKPGIFYLSKKANIPIVPINTRARLNFTFFWRWDKYIVPLPFSEVRVNAGKAIMPSEAGKVDLKKILDQLAN